MKKTLLLATLLPILFSISFATTANAQYSGLSVSTDKTMFCDQSSIIHVTGSVRANPGGTSGYHFVGMIFHFYIGSGSPQVLIGNYTIRDVSGTIVPSYVNTSSTYFNGAMISMPAILQNSYSSSLPTNGGNFMVSFSLPWYAFPTSTGIQFYVAVEAIDQVGSTTIISSPLAFLDPILYPNSPISKPTIQATLLSLCNGEQSTITTNPDLSGTYGYLWYKDGNLVSGAYSSSLTTLTPGSYAAYIYDGCQSVTTDPITITTGSIPVAPVVTASPGTVLCNGGTTTLVTSPSAGGTIHWNTGETGNSITVSTAGNYYAYETNNCGTGPNSNTITVTEGDTHTTPVITSSAGTSLCNGATTVLNVTTAPPGTIYWNNGQTGSSMTVSTSGTYQCYVGNACGTTDWSNAIVITAGSVLATPVISPSGPLNICDYNPTTLSVIGGGNTNWYSNGSLIGVNSGTITVNQAATYTAILYNGCGSSATSNPVIITAGITPVAPSISSNNGNLLCNGAATTITANAQAGATNYWSNGSSGNSISVSTAGSFYAVASNSCGTSANSNVVTIATNITPPAPTLNTSGNILLCDGAGQNLSTAPATSGGVIHWPSGFSGNNITVYDPGTYYAYETNGCGNGPNSASVNITTSAKPFAPVITPPGNLQLCNGASGTFTSSGTNISWSNGTTGNTMTTATAGTYYAYDHNACGNSPNSNSVAVTTVICPTPSPGTSFFVCPGTQKTLDAGGGYDTYAWSNGATTQKVTVGQGSYSVSVSKNGCNASSALVTVAYYTVTTPTITALGPTTFCAGGNVTLNASVGTSYSWSTGSTANNIIASTSGNYFVTVIDANGCPATSLPTTVTVNQLATATITGSAIVCQNGSSPVVTFNANGGVPPYTFTYSINGGTNQLISTSSGNSISLTVPTSTAGTYNYTLHNVKESGSTACNNSDIVSSATVVVRALPTATIAGTTTVCKNASSPQIIFTGSGGTAPYVFSYSVNGGATQTATTTVGNSVSIDAPTNSAGTFTYTLVSVSESGNSCTNLAMGTATITVQDLPIATIAGDAIVCQNAAQPIITFTGNGGIIPYVFSYSINGGSTLSLATVNGNTASIPVPTDIPGNYSYHLTGVTETSHACSNSLNATALITVRALPTATISGTTTVCQNSANPSITFSGIGGTAPYVFAYSINGGTPLTVTSTGNTVSISVSTSGAGTFTYALVSVQESGIGSCSNSVTGSATVTVNPQPLSAILTMPNAHLCNGDTGQIKISNYVTGYTYTWYQFGVPFKTSTLDTIRITQAGVYTVLTTSDKGCAAAFTSNEATITTGSVSTPIITGMMKVCMDGHTILAVAPKDKAKPYEIYRWTDTPIGDTINMDRSFSAPAGQYQLIAERQGCRVHAIVNVTADDTEFPAGELQLSNTNLSYGESLKLTALVTGATTYDWDFGDGNKAITNTNTVSENYYPDHDTATIRLITYSDRKCMTAFTSLVTVTPQAKTVIPDHSFTGNLKDWNLFPTPFHNELKLSVILDRIQQVRLDFFTPDGSYVSSWQFSGKKGENLFTLDQLQTLAPNTLYFVSSIYNNQKHFDKVYKY